MARFKAVCDDCGTDLTDLGSFRAADAASDAHVAKDGHDDHQVRLEKSTDAVAY